MKTYFNWSGGKDSALGLYHTQQDSSLQVSALFTSVNAAHNRVSMHGVRRELLEAQAHSIGLPLYTAELPEIPGMSDYERIMEKGVTQLRNEGYEAAIFGDIFLEDLKRYREEQLAKMNMPCIFPLWQKDTRQLVQEFIALGFKAIIVCVNSRHLDESFCGRILDESFLADLPEGVDPCGENGEYHSFVFDGPIFSKPILFTIGEKVYREYAAPKDDKDQCFSATPQTASGFYFLDLLPH